MKTEFRVEGKKLIISADLAKDTRYKISNTKNIFSVSIFKRPIWVTGISSKCEDGTEVLFLDYDDVNRSVVEQDILNLLNIDGLPSFYLFTTKEEKDGDEYFGNYHAICLAKLHPTDVVEYMQRTHCDSAYITMPMRKRDRSWVLRTSVKGSRGRPQFIKIIQDKDSDYEISTAHKNALEALYSDIPKMRYRNEDKATKLSRHTYETGDG